MDGVDLVAVFSGWLHLMAAVVSMGGASFMYFVLRPAVKESLPDEQHELFREAVRRRWAKFVHASITVLLVTGFFNFYWLVLRPEIKPMPYHAFFGPKLLAALIIFFLASVLSGKSPGFEKWRKDPSKLLLLIIVLAMGIFFVTELLAQIRVDAAVSQAVAKAVAAGLSG